MISAFHTSAGHPEEALQALNRSQECFLRQCMEAHDPTGCMLYAANGLSAGEEEIPRVVVALQQGCADGDSACCVQAGSILVSDEHPHQDQEAGIKLLAYACDQKNSDGCLSYAAVLESQEPKKDALIEEAYRQSCDLGSPEGCLSYGTLLVASKKYNEALTAVEKAHGLEESEPFALSGWIHATLNQPAQARAMFERACQLGDQEACLYKEK